MPWSPNYTSRSPSRVYDETQALRQRHAQAEMNRLARANAKRIAGVIEEHGERMSDEGLGLLMDLVGAFRKIGEALKGRR